MTSDSHTSDSHGTQAAESTSQDSASAQAAADPPKTGSEGLSLLFIIGAFAFYFALQLWILPAMGVST